MGLTKREWIQEIQLWEVARKAVRAAIDREEAISACLREVEKG